jgi:hypothetical protein
VQRWLSVYQQAWAAKDTAKLAQLGEYTAAEAAEAKEVLSRFSEYRVELTDVRIEPDGDRQVRVTAKRVDTMAFRGAPAQTREHPEAQTFVLRKDGTGSIVQVK